MPDLRVRSTKRQSDVWSNLKTFCDIPRFLDTILIRSLLNNIKIFLQIIVFLITQMVICLQYLHVKYCIIQYLVKKREMPIKFKHKKDDLISLYELDALFFAHLLYMNCRVLFGSPLFDWAPQ